MSATQSIFISIAHLGKYWLIFAKKSLSATLHCNYCKLLKYLSTDTVKIALTGHCLPSLTDSLHYLTQKPQQQGEKTRNPSCINIIIYVKELFLINHA